MQEIWKTYEYSEYSTIEVSNLGNVKKDGVFLKKMENHDGYLTVALKKKKGKNSHSNVFVHRLVLCAFVDERFYKDGLEVNHKDYNRQNNCLDNLEWVTHGDNVRYSVCNKPDMNGKNNPNYGNKKLSKIYSENPEYALEKQSRKGLQNGRCRKIRMYGNGIDLTFDYITECIKYIVENNISNTDKIDSIRGQIDKCFRCERKYKGYSFKKY
jgi:hypothetical protein